MKLALEPICYTFLSVPMPSLVHRRLYPTSLKENNSIKIVMQMKSSESSITYSYKNNALLSCAFLPSLRFLLGYQLAF